MRCLLVEWGRTSTASQLCCAYKSSSGCLIESCMIRKLFSSFACTRPQHILALDRLKFCTGICTSDLEYSPETMSSHPRPPPSSVLQDISYQRFRAQCSQRFSLSAPKVDAVVALLEGGSTVPFIVRYRSYAIGSLEAADVFALNREVASFAAMVKNRNAKIATLDSTHRLTPAVREIFNRCMSVHDVDEAWTAFKETKDSKLSQILSVPGIERLVDDVMSGKLRSVKPISMGTCKYDFNEAFQYLLAERIGRADSAVSEQASRCIRAEHVLLSVKLKTGKTLPPDHNPVTCKYKQYHHLSLLPLSSVRDHQALAIRRGQKEGILALTFTVSESAERALRGFMAQRYHSRSPTDALAPGIEEALSRVLVPARQRAVWRAVLKDAEESALHVFCKNLRCLLLTPPLFSYFEIQCDQTRQSQTADFSVLGMDPGFSNGHKLAVVAPFGSSILATAKIFPRSNGRGRGEGTDSRKMTALDELRKLCDNFNVKVVAIGDGVGSRAAQQLVEEGISVGQLPADLVYSVVSEAGASVYSVSTVAKEQHPDVDISFLGAVSIARRLVDPLSELVKIPPGSLGIGMYQHDLSSTDLANRLAEIIEECVNGGGVDLNTCGAYLLMYVSGMNSARAKAVISHRELHGPFERLSDLKKVKGVGECSFRNAAGFLRVYGGSEILDTTAVHPDHYAALKATVEWAHGERDVGDTTKKRKMSNKLQPNADISVVCPSTVRILRETADNIRGLPSEIVSTMKQLILGPASCVDFDDVVTRTIQEWCKWLSDDRLTSKSGSVPWLSDIVPGKPPLLRGKEAILVSKMDKSKQGGADTPIEGVVKNIVPFGAFVDIGLSSDGLIHRSQFLADNATMSSYSKQQVEQFKLRDLAIGQRVQVFVLSESPPNRIELGFQPKVSFPKTEEQNITAAIPPTRQRVVELNGTKKRKRAH